MKISEESVEKMISAGAKRWTRGDHDRLYLHAEQLGMEVEYYNTGNICYAELNGEKISNSYAREILASNPYIDINDGSVHVSRYNRSETAIELAQAFLDKYAE